MRWTRLVKEAMREKSRSVVDEEAGKTFSLQQCVDSLEEAISAARKAKVSVVEEEMREARETVTPARSAALKKK